jgi:hypothetical protein
LLGSSGGGGSGPATTRRSAGKDLATARGVELDLGGATERGGQGHARARARFGSGEGASSEAADEEAGEREARRRGIAVSDSGSDGGDGGADGGGGKRRALTEEEREEQLAAKGKNKARAWLESGFHHMSGPEVRVWDWGQVTRLGKNLVPCFAGPRPLAMPVHSRFLEAGRPSAKPLIPIVDMKRSCTVTGPRG